ncbi:ester cyclase [Streptomyces platensis]|uniref:ester cyclase n=1 Tax=Streptomyces platensis TaxID=58346 RepID=UPI0036940F70
MTAAGNAPDTLEDATTRDLRHLVDDYVRRVWNGHDASAVAEFAPDDTALAFGDTPVTYVSRSELVQRVAHVLTLIPDHHLTVGTIVVQGEEVIWEWRLTGTFHDERGAFPVDAKGLTYWQVRDGLIVARNGVMDLMTWAWQIKAVDRRIQLLMPV